MAISELSVLISAEQDVKLANKDHGQKISEEETQSSQSDFFSQLQSANNAVETPNNKLSAPEPQDAVDTESNQETNKTQRDPAISGDEMLAQINAANNLDTNVKSTRSDQPATSVIDLLDKYSQEKLDPGLVKVNAPRPIDAVTPIIDVPLEDDSKSIKSNSVVELLDKYSQQKLDPELVKVNAPRPIDAVTPIIDAPIEDDSAESKGALASDKTAIAEAIGKEVKFKGDPGDAVTPIVDEIQSNKNPAQNLNGVALNPAPENKPAEAVSVNKETISTEKAATLKLSEGSAVTASNNDKLIPTQPEDKNTSSKGVATDAAVAQPTKVLQEAVTGATSDKPALLTAAIAKSPEVNQIAQALLSANENGLNTNDKILSSLSNEQQTKLQAQLDAITAQGVTAQGISSLKQTIAQFMVSNSDANPVIKNAIANTNVTVETPQLSDEIANLSTSEKQELAKQLQQFIATEKPQGAVLNQVNSALAELEGKPANTVKEPQLNAQTATQVANNTPLESSKTTPIHSAAGSALSQDQANKQVVQQSVVKEQVMVDKDNAEALAPRETPVVRINQLFAQITTAANQITNSAVTGMNEVIDQRYQQEIADMQVLNAQQTTATSQSKQINVDPTLLQALNIVKSDAAKLLQERVSALLNINNKEAEIRLDPPEMGSMQIRIRSDAEQAQINFVVQNQQAKEALEQSMPKLREMLAEQGIELGESSIQQGDSQENMAEQQQQNAQGQLAQQDDEATDVHASTENTEQQSSSSIDYYA